MIIFIVLLILAAILIGGCLRFRYSFTCPADIIGRVIQNGFRLPPKKLILPLMDLYTRVRAAPTSFFDPNITSKEKPQ